MRKIIYVGNDKWFGCFEVLTRYNNLDIVHAFIPNDSVSLKQRCLDLNIEFTITDNINDNYVQISNLNFDLYVVLGHPFLLKENLLDVADGIGFHPSMLPRRRGRAPINWAIIDGLDKSGVSIFYLDKGVDSGDIIYQEEFIIEADDTAAKLIDKVSTILANNLPGILLSWPDFSTSTQDNSKASYTIKRKPEDGEITFEMSALEAERLVRALNGPYPSAFITMNNGERLYINEASINEFKQ